MMIPVMERDLIITFSPREGDDRWGGEKIYHRFSPETSDHRSGGDHMMIGGAERR